MKIFLDTSSLIKLYFNEEGTSALDTLFVNNSINEIFISEIARIEFYSAIYKKLRAKVLNPQNYKDILNAFIEDEHKFNIVLIDRQLISTSQALLEKYGLSGLRTLDAIQLASVAMVRDSIDMAISHDKLLNMFFTSEEIKTF